jgi:hypothetical protein
MIKRKNKKKFTWNPDLAYVIGLLTTDGSLSNDKRHITLRSSDRQILENFRKILLLRAKIARTKNDGWAKKPCLRIQLSDVQFYNWLLKIGLFPNKTYKIGKLKIPNNYFKDFLRGHLDGDGCISTYKDKWNTFKDPKYVYTRLWVRFYSASQIHMDWLQKTVKKLLGISGHLCEEKPKRYYQNTSMWVLKFGKKDSLKILSWIYYHPNVICLERKRKIAEKFITNMAG